MPCLADKGGGLRHLQELRSRELLCGMEKAEEDFASGCDLCVLPVCYSSSHFPYLCCQVLPPCDVGSPLLCSSECNLSVLSVFAIAFSMSLPEHDVFVL